MNTIFLPYECRAERFVVSTDFPDRLPRVKAYDVARDAGWTVPTRVDEFVANERALFEQHAKLESVHVERSRSSIHFDVYWLTLDQARIVADATPPKPQPKPAPLIYEKIERSFSAAERYSDMTTAEIVRDKRDEAASLLRQAQAVLSSACTLLDKHEITQAVVSTEFEDASYWYRAVRDDLVQCIDRLPVWHDRPTVSKIGAFTPVNDDQPPDIVA